MGQLTSKTWTPERWTSAEYAQDKIVSYQENIADTLQEEKLLLSMLEEKYGIKVKKLERAMNIRSKLNGGITFNAIGFWPFIALRKMKYAKPTAIHEANHVLQYRDLCSLKWIGEWIGFIKLGIETRNVMKESAHQRKNYGKIYAQNYKVDNAPMEREAYMHQDNPRHLDTREKFEWRKYETKAGRSAAIMQSIDYDITQKVGEMDTWFNGKGHKEDFSDKDIEELNACIGHIVQDVEKMIKIKEQYGKDDWELVVFRDHNEKLQVRAESETNRNKRFALTENLLAKEKQFLDIIATYQDIAVVSTKEQLEYGIIQMKVKKWIPETVLEQILKKNVTIQKLHPQMMIDPLTSYIKVNFIE